MSKTLTAPHTNGAARSLQSDFEACARKVFDRAFGSEKFLIGASEPVIKATETGECLWFDYEFTPELGHASFGLERTAAHELGHRLLRAKGRASEHDHHAIHAINHLMGQIADEFATRLASRINTGIEPIGSPDSPKAGVSVSFAQTLSLPLTEANCGSYVLLVGVSAELVAALSDALPDAPLPSVPAAISPLRNLDMLLDIELPVTISFGTTRIPLKEVVKLSSGSTIELNRPLSQPIEVLVNDRSIARGEMIVVDGKFAVRIKDIVSRQDRLRSLA